MTDDLQHGNWSELGPNNSFVRLDNISSKILFPMDFSQRAQMLHEALFSHQEITTCVTAVDAANNM